VPQDRTEALLLAALEGHAGEVERPAELLAATTESGKIVAMVAGGGRTRPASARWLVGCDGMHSRVREAGGIAFDGGAYAQTFGSVDDLPR